MIILKHTKINFNHNFQNEYYKCISKLHLSKISCSCENHNWSFHCRYKRYVDFFGFKLRIKIIRIRCLCCGKTHAILFEDIIPFSCINQTEVITLLEEYNTSDQSSYLHFLKSKFTPELLNDYCSLCISASRNFQIIFSST